MSLSATSTVPASIKPHVGYSWSWWIKPLGVLDGWTNVFHKGKDDSQRNIAVWMYGNTRRMHIRSQNMLEGVESAPGSGQYPNNNDGLDPNQELALNQWTHVVLIHHHQRMEVCVRLVLLRLLWYAHIAPVRCEGFLQRSIGWQRDQATAQNKRFANLRLRQLVPAVKRDDLRPAILPWWRPVAREDQRVVRSASVGIGVY